MELGVRLLRIFEKLPPELRGPLTEMVEVLSQEMGERLTKKEFQEFVARFEAFAERTEENFRKVWQAINELTEAQKRTEERVGILEQKIIELAEAQKRTEERLNILEQKIIELAEAQKRTEERLNILEQKIIELTEAQKRTEEEFRRVWQAINELAKGQKRLEEEVRLLKVRVEGLSDTVGYTLENRAYKTLPAILKEHGIIVEGRLRRCYLRLAGKDRQVNIYGHGLREGKPLLILGEAKTRISKKKVSRFERLAELVEKEEGLPSFRLIVAHDFPPAVEALLKERGILPVWSYEVE